MYSWIIKITGHTENKFIETKATNYVKKMNKLIRYHINEITIYALNSVDSLRTWFDKTFQYHMFAIDGKKRLDNQPKNASLDIQPLRDVPKS